MVSEPKGVALELSSHFSCTESIQDEAFRPDFDPISTRFRLDFHHFPSVKGCHTLRVRRFRGGCVV